jgi:hypothetical protein
MKVSLFDKSRSRLPGTGLHWILAAALLFLGLAARTSVAAADGVKTFNIERQTLSSALNEFARQSDRQILFSTEIVRSKQARSIKGQLEPEAALRLLLKGTGLKFRVTSDNTILVEVASGGDTADLPVPADRVRLVQVGGTSSAASANAAEQTSSEDNPGRESLGEVTVTGSRIVQQTQSTPPAQSPLKALWIHFRSSRSAAVRPPLVSSRPGRLRSTCEVWEVFAISYSWTDGEFSPRTVSRSWISTLSRRR